jgi:hypothetical protein
VCGYDCHSALQAGRQAGWWYLKPTRVRRTAT